MTEHLGASPYERCAERQGDRHGVRPRTPSTRVGPVTLQVPQTRDGRFSPEIFKRDQRSEQAFVLALMERVVHGVSTRKVTEITEALCGASFSKSTVSALCAQLEPRIRAFHERRLTASPPFVRVDALELTVREDDRVVSKAALIATGIRDDGGREILGLEIGDSESFAAWEDFFGRRLSRGGLRGRRECDGASREVPPAAAHDPHAGAPERGDPPAGAGDPDLPRCRVGPPSHRVSLGRTARDVGRAVLS